MKFRLADGLPVLRRTPDVLTALLEGLPDTWLRATEGPDTWSPFDVVGHLIHGERTNWIPRIDQMLASGDSQPFRTFDREAMLAASRGRPLAELLDEFAALRHANLERLVAFGFHEADLESVRGRHPDLGPVTLGQHLATWVAHDLGHLDQVVRTMGRQYTIAVGPWREFMSMLRPPPPPEPSAPPTP